MKGDIFYYLYDVFKHKEIIFFINYDSLKFHTFNYLHYSLHIIISIKRNSLLTQITNHFILGVRQTMKKKQIISNNKILNNISAIFS